LNIELTLSGAGLIAGLLAVWRLFRQGKWRPPILGQDVRDIIPTPADPETEEDDLDARAVRDIIREELKDHCSGEQKKLAKTIIGEVQAMSMETEKWRGCVDARLDATNGHDRDLHKRMDRMEDNMRKDIDSLRKLILEWIQGRRGGESGP
jgi:hypothetical protein